MNSQSPRFPSLYDPTLELVNIQGRPPTQPGAVYLTRSSEIYKFTLYWCLILSLPCFLVAGIYAFFNLSIPPSPSTKTHPYNTSRLSAPSSHYPLSPSSPTPESHLLPLTPPPPSAQPKPTLSSARPNPRRSRFTFALLVLLTFAFVSFFSAVVGSAVIAWVLVGLWRAGDFTMSTWVPFIWALIMTLVGLLGTWPSVIDTI